MLPDHSTLSVARSLYYDVFADSENTIAKSIEFGLPRACALFGEAL